MCRIMSHDLITDHGSLLITLPMIVEHDMMTTILSKSVYMHFWFVIVSCYYLHIVNRMPHPKMKFH